MPSASACCCSAFQRAGPAGGNSFGASPRLSRYSQITGLSYSAMPSSVMRVGTLDSGLCGARAGSVVPIRQFSIRPSRPRATAQAETFRT